MSKGTSHTLEFHGRGAEYFKIWIVNLLLTIVTLGIYSAWAKVRTKKYFYNHQQLNGEAFDYHAKPMQILIGRLIAVVCFGVFIAAGVFSQTLASLLLLAFYAVLPLLVRNNTRFDCAMSSYQNIRFSFVGTVGGIYGALWLRWLAVVTALLLTALIFAPLGTVIASVLAAVAYLVGFSWAMARLNGYFLNGYGYGKYRFDADLHTDGYIKIYVLTALVAIVALAGVVAAIVAFVWSSGLITDIPSVSDLEAYIAPEFFVVALYALALAPGLVAYSFMKVKVRSYNFSQTRLYVGSIEQGTDTTLFFESDMKMWSFLWLLVSNFLLLVCTLGLATPWVKVRTARYVAERTLVVGDIDSVDVQQASVDSKGSIADGMADTFDIGVGVI